MNERTSAASQTSTRLPLGDCTLDLGAGELVTGQGELAVLRRQALDLLLVLGRRAEHVVTKDELMSLVWPDVVVGEGSLTQAIFEVRRARRPAPARAHGRAARLHARPERPATTRRGA